jgi:hypothetical protein
VLVRVAPDGTEKVTPIPSPTPMSPEEAEAAAAADLDARSFTPEELVTARRAPFIKTLRRALDLTQEEFAARYRIPLGTFPNDAGGSRCDPQVYHWGSRPVTLGSGIAHAARRCFRIRARISAAAAGMLVPGP